jgi:hypothetical protein
MRPKIGSDPIGGTQKSRLCKSRKQQKDTVMLKKLAVALVAASVFAAPVLAQTGSTGTPASPAKPAVAAPVAPSKVTDETKSVKPVKKNRHTGKQVRRGGHGKVAGIHGKSRTVIKGSGHGLKGTKVLAQKGAQTGAGTIR